MVLLCLYHRQQPDRHVAPLGLWGICLSVCYRHVAPLGLNELLNRQNLGEIGEKTNAFPVFLYTINISLGGGGFGRNESRKA